MGYIKLRKLKADDASGMYEWMTDPETGSIFQFDPSSITYESVQKFIENASTGRINYHFAITEGEDDIYLGTISLKNVNLHHETAEYAIALRNSARGRGIGLNATREILKFAFYELGLRKIYLNVLSDNCRAISLYKKCGFQYEGAFKDHLIINNECKTLLWFCFFKEEFSDTYSIC